MGSASHGVPPESSGLGFGVQFQYAVSQICFKVRSTLQRPLLQGSLSEYLEGQGDLVSTFITIDIIPPVIPTIYPLAKSPGPFMYHLPCLFASWKIDTVFQKWGLSLGRSQNKDCWFLGSLNP